MTLSLVDEKKHYLSQIDQRKYQYGRETIPTVVVIGLILYQLCIKQVCLIESKIHL